jgi:hypothetical protein
VLQRAWWALPRQFLYIHFFFFQNKEKVPTQQHFLEDSNLNIHCHENLTSQNTDYCNTHRKKQVWLEKHNEFLSICKGETELPLPYSENLINKLPPHRWLIILSSLLLSHILFKNPKNKCKRYGIVACKSTARQRLQHTPSEQYSSSFFFVPVQPAHAQWLHTTVLRNHVTFVICRSSQSANGLAR